jgi:hypothetical protein
MTSNIYTGVFECEFCDEAFINHRNYLKHNRIVHQNKIFENINLIELFDCCFCSKNCNSLQKLKNHLFKCKLFYCPTECKFCKKYFIKKVNFIRHTLRDINQIGFGRKSRLPKLPTTSQFKLSKQCFKSFLQQYELFPEETYNDCEEFFINYRDDIFQLVNLLIEKLTTLKLQICIQCTFYREIEDIIIYTTAYFCTKNLIIEPNVDLEEIYSNVISYLDNEINTFESLGSGWVIEEIDRLDLRIAIYIPTTGGCGQSNLILPELLQNKKCVITFNNNDNKCFLYCVLAFLALHSKYQKQTRDLNRISSLKKFQKFLTPKALEFPVNIKSIKKFETDNKHLNIRFNIYGYSKEIYEPLVFPVYISKRKAKHTIKILLYENHYYLIKNFNRLIGSYQSNYHHFCYNCLSGFRTLNGLENHIKNCKHFKPTAIEMPQEKEFSFEQYNYMYKFPYVMFADFESILVKENIKLSNKTKLIQKHKACGYALIIIKGNSNIYHKESYRGEDCISVFLSKLKKISEELFSEISCSYSMLPLTNDEKTIYKNTTICRLCKQEFTNPNNPKVRDHDHLTGKFRSGIHKNCNIKYTVPEKIPLLFHNLKGYDSHFIIENINLNVFEECNIIPNSLEKYLAIQLDKVRILDSCQFLNESLDNLVKNLNKSNGQFNITKKIFNKYTQDKNDKIELLFQKSFYPYEYMDSFERFNETILPSIDKFYSSLTLKSISETDYMFAKQVWKKFKMKNLGDYHDFYVMLDTSLLADVFQAFRNTIIQIYELDPCHFYSIPGLAWSAALKYTNIKLEYIQDIDIYMFVENAIRGGMCGVTKRYAKSNNRFSNNFDQSKETTYISHLDVNNLYGKALSEKLPVSNFEWIEKQELDEIDWKTINTENDYGYIIECDLKYPIELHDKHKDYPLAPLKQKISNEKLSKYQMATLEYLKQYGYKRVSTEKLLLTLEDKMKYTLHFKTLKLYLDLGLELLNIYRGIRFKQLAFLQPYIEFNTTLRSKANSDFEKDLYKLMNNSVFGKSIEDKRKHLNLKLVLNEKQCSSYVRKPNFEQFHILNEHASLIKLNKSKVILDKPIAIGFTVLDLSKRFMYLLHYKIFKDYYNDNITLLYTDTDSFVYEIKTNSYFKDLKNYFAPIMDFSNFNKNHKLFSEKNKKLIGYLKSEYGEKNVDEFIGIKSKLYSIMYDNEKENKKTAKGLQKCVLNKYITHDIYRDVIHNQNVLSTKMKRIQSKQHKLQTVELTKLIFHPFDDKRYILDNGIDTLPFGHYSIE